jgi:trk system potassium uptake protein TrkA
MRVIIIGAGNAGRRLAAKLYSLHHDIVLIDVREAPLKEAEAQLDILTIEGHGASPSVLEAAEISKADLLLAVTSQDEVNILACMYGQAAGVSNKLARVSNNEYTNESYRLDLHGMGVDKMICHKEESAREMQDVVRMPGALEALDLLNGRMFVVGVDIPADSPLTQAPLKDLSATKLIESMRFIGAIRDEQQIIPRGDVQLMAGDVAYIAIQPADADAFLDWACPNRMHFEKVVIAGGGDVGLRLAELLEEDGIPVTLMEHDDERAEYCSGLLHKALVLHGDTLDGETLENAGVADGTAFVAATGDDENNIISCLLARKLGASFTMAQISKPEYVPIVDNLRLINKVVSPHLSMINAIMPFVRGGNVRAATLLQKLEGEFLEIAVTSDGSWHGKPIKKIKVPGGAIIAAVLRENELLIPTGELQLEVGDELLVFAQPNSVEKLRSLIGK